MKYLITTIFIFSFLNYVVGGVADSTVRKDYKKNLEYSLRNFQSIKDWKDVDGLIPVSAEEAIIYFSCYYDKDLSKPFQTFEKKVFDLIMKGNTTIFRKYLYMSEFVDGYFAEDYFDSLGKVAKSNRKFFCSGMSKIDTLQLKRLTEIKGKYCR